MTDDPAAKPKRAVTTTTLRLPAETLRRLKIIAATEDVKLNDLLLQGVAHVLAVRGEKGEG